MVQLVENGDKTDYSIKGDGGLYFKKQIMCTECPRIENEVNV